MIDCEDERKRLMFDLMPLKRLAKSLSSVSTSSKSRSATSALGTMDGSRVLEDLRELSVGGCCKRTFCNLTSKSWNTCACRAG